MVQDQAVNVRASAGALDNHGAGVAADSSGTLNEELRPATSHRVLRSLALRTRIAGSDAFRPAPAQIDNGDEARYSDKSGSYTKGVRQAGIGLVDLGAYATFKAALSSGAPADFEKIILGGPRTLNGPQAGLAFYLDSLDGSQYLVPPAPALASEAYAAELIELYWASLLRDVPFGGYEQSSVATRAAAELSSLPDYAGPRDAPVRSSRGCCSAVASRARNGDPTCPSSCSCPPRWGRCRSPSSTSATRRASTS